jgi:TRAP-type transport system periplasmic protein
MHKYTISGAVGALLSLLSVGPSQAQQFTMKLSAPTVNDIIHEWMKTFKAGVEEKTRNRVKVEIYPANQLGQIPATVEGVALGTIQVTSPATGFFIGLEPRFLVFDAPGLFDDMAHAQRVLADPEARKRLATFGKNKGVEPLVVYPHGPLQLLSHKPVRSVQDFKGLKIRVAGSAPLHTEPFKKLGASPLSMPLGEVLPAMQNRVIDGLIASSTVFTASKFYDVAKPATYLPGSFLFVGALASSDFLKSLGPELEGIVRDEAYKAQLATAGWAIEDVQRTVKSWEAAGGENISLPPEEAKRYIDDVTATLPTVMRANSQLKEDYEALLAIAKKHRQQ